MSAGTLPARPSRSRIDLGLRPTWPALGGALLVVVAAVAVGETVTGSYLDEINQALIAAIGALGLNLLTGYAGQVSIGNAAFLGIGSYTVVLLHGHLPFLVVVLAGGVFAALVGIVVGVPALRLRGLYLIFATLALTFIAQFAFTQYDSRTGAIAGHFITNPSLFGLTLASTQQWYVVLVVIAAIATLFCINIVRGRSGRAYVMVRTNEAAAAVIGVDVRATKFGVFCVSSFLIGVAGTLSAYYLQEVSASYFDLDLAVSYIAMILIGGLASIPGSILGAFIVTLLPYTLQQAFSSGAGTGFFASNQSSIDLAVYGVLIIVFLLFRPAGLASLLHIRWRRGRRRTQRARNETTGTQPWAEPK